MTDTAQTRYACKECTRTDLSLTADGRVRSHAANGRRPGPDNPNCPGSSDRPKGAEPDAVPVTASGGPNPYRAPLPTGNLPHDRTEPDNWQEAIGPAKAHGNPTEDPKTVVTEAADVFDSPAPVVQRAEQKVERDGWGRYKLIHPTTGKKQAFQRCTTFAKMLEDTFGLGKWQRRMAAKGLALRPDLLDMVATLDVKQDSQRMDLLLEQAMDAAGQKVAANQGTVCHKHTEDVDRGDTALDQVPVKYRADVTAYTETLRQAGITIVPQMIERITVVADLGVGGTLDRVVRDRAGKYRVLDVKTGNMDFGQLGICIQLAVYAAGVNSAGVYDLDTGTWAPPNSYGDSIETGPWSVPHVETDYALVAHIPVGSGTCKLLKVPIDTGWEAVQTAAQVRDWRRMKKLFTAYDPEDVPSSPYLEQLAAAVGDTGTVLDGGPSAEWTTPYDGHSTIAVHMPPTWEDRFRAVASRAEAMKLYAEAEATLGAGPRLTSLVQIGMATLEQLSG